MKELLGLIAEKLVAEKLSNESILACGSILKRSFIEQGFSRALSNDFAIDALKITLTTLSKIK